MTLSLEPQEQIKKTLWKYLTPGISDHLFARSPGIAMSKRETRLLILSSLKLEKKSVLWNVGAGTGTLLVEVALLCPEVQIVAIERDEDVTELISINCTNFGIKNVEIIAGTAPNCLSSIASPPDRVCIEAENNIDKILSEVWKRLNWGGRVVITTSTLQGLYQIFESLTELQACNLEVIQPATRLLQLSAQHRLPTEPEPVFVISADKLNL